MAPSPVTEQPPTQLFVQAFQSGSLAPSTSEFGTHTVTLAQGLGQTIVFTDRPSREVFTAPTPAFLDGLGFPADNPPNAAILMDAGDGTTDIAVVELFNPTYDEATHTATYDVSVLANWQNDLELGFQDEPVDLSDLSDSFGATHLFIDGCFDGNVLFSSRRQLFEGGGGRMSTKHGGQVIFNAFPWRRMCETPVKSTRTGWGSATRPLRPVKTDAMRSCSNG